MVKFAGSEAFRSVMWVLIEERHTDGWHIGGEPFAGPSSLMATRGRAKAVYEMIDGTPSSATSSLWPPKAEATWQPGEADGINQNPWYGSLPPPLSRSISPTLQIAMQPMTLGAVVGLMTWT
ncbi:hypothetical protein [Phyllobacterium chamaecytisi]|uniref:hypothetical protein n=1 Tax=Phyllobacterium chamaecytisi TaxID=2876082 RepID=UPI001CCCCD53|nr:hypothetical protein [Phyllobacterium sp. KW56]MBZ9605914.1 hypothetical protein [Phyllobacterium sp. KW56]